MNITIVENNILDGQTEIGTIRRFCCGTDIRLNKFPESLFSVLNVRKSEKSKLIKCVKRLLQEESIPDNHFNFKMEMIKRESPLYKLNHV